MFSAMSFAQSQQQNFSKLLAQAEKTFISLPSQARAIVLQMEEDKLGLSQPPPLLARYHLLSAKIAVALANADDAQRHAKIGLTLTYDKQELRDYRRYLQLSLVQGLMLAQNYEQALRQLKVLLAESSEENKSYRSELLMVKAQIYELTEQSDIALTAYKAAYQLAQVSGDNNLLQRVAIAFAGRLVQYKGFNKAEALLNESRQYFHQHRMSLENLIAQINLAELAYHRNDTDEALSLLASAKHLADTVGSGTYRFVIELRVIELMLEMKPPTDRALAKITAALVRVDLLSSYARTASEKERLVLAHARHKVALKDFSGLTQMLADYGPFVLSGNYQADRRALSLLQLKAQGLASTGQFEAAYQALLVHQGSFVIHNRRRNSENLERQQLIFDLDLLEQRNQNLNWNNILQELELKRHGRTVAQLFLLLLIIASVAAIAILFVMILYRKRHQLYQLAYCDHLTGLYNRRYLYLSFQLLKHQYTKHLRPLTGLMLDLDHFKQVNDQHGHGTGDKALIAFADCCRQSLPDNAIVIRLGGEEVLALLPDCNIKHGEAWAEKLRIAVEKLTVTSEDHEQVKLTVSIGVACLGEQIKDQTQLLDLADQRLYAAKSGGRNRVIASDSPPVEHGLKQDPLNQEHVEAVVCS